MKPLTQMVVSYIEEEGVAVADWLALEIPDNLEVAAQDPVHLLDHYKRLDLTGIDALVLSACVQMPSLPSVQKIEDAIGLPVVSAAICTAHQKIVRGSGRELVWQDVSILGAGVTVQENKTKE